MTAASPVTSPSAARVRRVPRALVVLVVAAALVLPPLGQRTITTSDEARFAILAQDVLERGAWFDAKVRERRYQNKPPLYPWSIALLSFPTGRVTEAAAQAPGALAAIVTVLVTCLLGDRLFGGRAGLWAALVLVTSYHFFEQSQERLPDMIMVAFETLAIYAFWRAVAPSPGRWALPGFYAALAFAVFAKGPAGLLPLLIGAVWLAADGGVRRLRRLWSPGGIALFALGTLGWLLPDLLTDHHGFVTRVVREDWITWYVGMPPPRRLVDSLLEGARGFIPWTLVAPLPFFYVWRAREDGAVRLALFAFLIPLVVMLASQNQRSRYLLPAYVGGALLVAWWAERHGAAPSTAVRVVARIALVGAPAAAAAIAYPWLELSRQGLVPGMWWKMLFLGLGAACVGSIVFVSLRAGRPGLLIHGVVATMVVLLASGIWIYNAWVNATQDFKTLAARVERQADGADTSVFGGRFWPLDFYLDRRLGQVGTREEFDAYVGRPDRPVVVLNGRTWERIQGKARPPVRLLDRMNVRGQEMLIVRSDGPLAVRVGTP